MRRPERFAAISAAFVGAGFVGAGFIGGCVVDEGPPGTTGTKGKVVFQAETPLVFSSRLAVGSIFQVTTVPKSAEVTLSATTVLASADEGVVTVTRIEGDELLFDVVAVGPGRVQLTVSDGDDVDAIFVEAARAADTTLVDAALLGASDAVDPRLPARFALIDDTPTRFLISAIDKCGGPLLDLGASSLVIGGDEGVDPATLATVTADGAAAFVVEPVQAAGGAFSVLLLTPEIETLAYDVDVVARGDVDEVHAEVASVDTQASTARLWGRAFVDDIDVVGLDYDWSVDPRVALDLGKGPAVTASISFVPDDTGVDLRPAEVSAEVFGTSGSTDLLTLQAGDLVAGRGNVPLRSAAADIDEAAPGEGASCAACPDAGGGACNALALAGAWALGRRRRRLWA